MTDWYLDVKDQLQDWSLIVGPFLKATIEKHPVRFRMRAIVDGFTAAANASGPPIAPPSGKPAKPPPKELADWIADAKKLGGEAKALKFPDLPKIEPPGDMAKRLGLEAKYGIPAGLKAFNKKVEEGLPPLDKPMLDYVERIKHPPSVFAEDRKALAAESEAKSPKEALAKAHAKELELRAVLEAVVGRVLPPQLRRLMVPLAGGFASLDESLAAAKKKPRKKGEKEEKLFPVKALPIDSGLLKPVVKRLRVFARTSDKGELKTFTEQLRRKLLAATFPAPA